MSEHGLQAREASQLCGPICAKNEVSEPKHLKQTVKLTEGTIPYSTCILVMRSSHGCHCRTDGLSLLNPKRALSADGDPWIWEH